MRLFRFVIHLWIALGSVTSFVVGWILLAHAPKPVQTMDQLPAMAAPLPTLAPLPELNFNGVNSGPVIQSPSIIIRPASPPAPMPIFRTGGS